MLMRRLLPIPDQLSQNQQVLAILDLALVLL